MGQSLLKQGAISMDIIERAKKICLDPGPEWKVIDEEQTPTAELLTGYVIPLAAIGAIAGFVGGSIVGRTIPLIGTFRTPMGAGIIGAIVAIAMAIVTVFLISVVVNALAPTFGAQPNSSQALKVTVYSFTPAWIGGILQIVPLLGILGFLMSLYGLYLLYLGLPRLMKCAEDKAVAYTAVVAVCSLIVMVISGVIVGSVTMAGLVGAGALGSVTPSGDAAEVVFDPDSTLGVLQGIGEALGEQAENMEAAQASGDTQAQVAATLGGLAAIAGGGRTVEPIDISELQNFIPETFLGLPRTSSNAERNGIGPLMTTRATGTFSDGAGRTANLEVIDTGGASGLMGLAGWMGIESQSENAEMSERTERVDGRMIHERISKVGGTHELNMVLVNRFLVNSDATGFPADVFRGGVLGLDIEGLEAMRDVGVED